MSTPEQKIEQSFQLLKEAVEGFEEINYRQVMVERNEDAYRITENFIKTEVKRYVEMYRSLTTLDQRARLIRDMIDLLLRRSHEYSIGGSIGSHYIESGVDIKNCIFEHMIPQSRIRDLLIQDCISIKQAMNPPTCLISKEHDKQLGESGFTSKTPSYWNFFDRYTKVFTAQYETFNGQEILDPHNWTLGKHYEFFGINE
jgi:hypothetical protein